MLSYRKSEGYRLPIKILSTIVSLAFLLLNVSDSLAYTYTPSTNNKTLRKIRGTETASAGQGITGAFPGSAAQGIAQSGSLAVPPAMPTVSLEEATSQVEIALRDGNLNEEAQKAFYTAIKRATSAHELNEENVKNIHESMHLAAERIGARVAEQENATGYSMWNIQEEHVALYNIKQFALTYAIMDRVFEIVDKSELDSDQKTELNRIITYFFYTALPEFIDGKKGNPIHHNVQTLENMLLIVLREKSGDFESLKECAFLALLHDIGNSKARGGKVTTNDLKAAKKAVEEALTAADRQTKQKELEDLVGKAIAYRDSHMKEGKALARELYAKYPGDAPLEDGAIERVCAAIAVHDNPSNAKYKTDYLKKEDLKEEDRDLLLRVDDELAKLLREADRLWMLSPEGFEKDLIDGKKKKFKEGKPAKDPEKQRAHNIEGHRDEYAVYAKMLPEDELAPYGFIDGEMGKSLYRTNAGYGLFQEFSENIDSLVQTSKPEAEPERALGVTLPEMGTLVLASAFVISLMSTWAAIGLGTAAMILYFALTRERYQGLKVGPAKSAPASITKPSESAIPERKLQPVPVGIKNLIAPPIYAL